MPRMSAYLNTLFDEGALTERIDRIATVGYDGFEVYGADQEFEAIASKRDEHDLEWVYLSESRPNLTDPESHDAALESIEESLDLAEKYSIRNLNVKSGVVQENVDRETQRQSVIDVLREAVPMAENAGVNLVLEPLNTRIDHPGQFTTTTREGAEIVRAADSPNVRLLFDFYHEQIMHGDLIRSFENTVDVVGHVHVADNPGRNQPGTGEINYARVFDAIAETDYDGFVGCEFTPTEGSEPEAVLRDVVTLW